MTLSLGFSSRDFLNGLSCSVYEVVVILLVGINMGQFGGEK